MKMKINLELKCEWNGDVLFGKSPKSKYVMKLGQICESGKSFSAHVDPSLSSGLDWRVEYASESAARAAVERELGVTE